MRNIKLIAILLLLPLFVVAKDCKKVKFGHEGPFVLYQQDNSVRVVSSDGEGTVFDTTYTKKPKHFAVDVTSTSGEWNFTVPLRKNYKQRWKLKQAEKILVISDLHGNMGATMAILTSNGVMDEEFNWSYGKNHLIIIGDIADRGRDDTAIYWLVYLLEEQARKAGGRVTLMQGNHEDMFLRGDLRYVNKAHMKFCKKLGCEWDELWGENSELGDWIRNNNMMMVVGDNLFVHAGLSIDLIEKGYKIKQVNKLSKLYLGMNRKEREKLDERNKFIFRSLGPIWYRGMVRDSEKQPAITYEELDAVLNYFGVTRVFVGHSEVDEVEVRYGDRVVAVNTPHYENFPRNGTAGVLIEGDKIYSVDYSGKRKELNN